MNGNAHATIAKERGGAGTAAVQVLSGVLAGASPGSYIIDKGRLEPLSDPALVTTHRDYLATSQREGDLHRQKEGLRATGRPVPSALQSHLDATAARASELRRQWFTRCLVRNTAKDNAREVLRQQNQNMRPSSF